MRYEIRDAAGELMWTSVDVEEGDDDRVTALEQSVLVPAGGRVLVYVDGKLWP